MSDREGIGEALAQARGALGLSLEEAAQQLKFSPRQLLALERGELYKLGTAQGGAFLRGMVRGYARLVKLDPEPLLERIADRVTIPDTDRLAARFQQPVPFSDGSRRLNLLYAGLSLGVLAVVGGIVFEWRHDEERPVRLTIVPAAPAPVDASRPAAPAAPAAELIAPPVVQPIAESQVEDAGPHGGRHRIVLRFDRESWVEIKDGDGRTLLSQLNSGGTQRTVDGNPPFSVVIGNAQHVRLLYDNSAVDLAPFVRVEVARLNLD